MTGVERNTLTTTAPALSAIVEQLIDGPGFALIPNLMDASEAAQARSRALEIAASPSASAFGKRNDRTGQQHVRGLLAHSEIFERMVQHPALIEIAEAMLGDDMTLGAYSARILYPGATEMGVHVDYPYWAMPGPFGLRPPLMVQVIWMLQDFTEHNGATLVAPGSQLRCARPNREQFAREAIKITGAAGDAIISHGLLWHDTSQNHTGQPRVALLINYGLKVIRPLDSEISKIPPAVLERATPKLRQLLGLEFANSLARDLARDGLY
jgi:ectoine hydroxylase-related dioxygenase (phytanoyl-CoA dioxygenase family)